MQITLSLKGRTGLVMHNIRLADPADEYARAITEINKKRDKTEADYEEIARLEWFGGIYYDPTDGPYVPSANVIRCLEQGGIVTKRGAAVVRALAVMSEMTPLDIGPKRDIKEMFAKPEYRLRRMVGIKRNKVVRVRPIFRSWSLTMDMELLTDVLSLDAIRTIATQAGLSAGLGDARKLGYGRFVAEVVQAS